MKNEATYVMSFTEKYNYNYYMQVWKYRGQEYHVTVPIGWGGSSDYHFNGYMSKANQHRRAQKSIDAKLDNPPKEPEKYTGKVEKAIEELFNYFEN